MHGTWKTTSGDGGGAAVAVLAVVAAVVLLGSGAAAAIASAVIVTVIVAGAVLALGVVALTVLVVCRLRHQEPQAVSVLAERGALMRAERERPALEQGGPREVHQHWHQHFHGVDEDRVAQILRRSQRPE